MMKPPSARRVIVAKPWLFPMAAQNLAAVAVQRVARGWRVRHPAAESDGRRGIHGAESKRPEDGRVDEDLAAASIQAQWRGRRLAREYKFHR